MLLSAKRRLALLAGAAPEYMVTNVQATTTSGKRVHAPQPDTVEETHLSEPMFGCIDEEYNSIGKRGYAMVSLSFWRGMVYCDL